ncbi:HAMP domain-containing protein [Rhizobium sp. CFBP 8762]|uniref:methyl-accepting chemotaxis protein n=1 Tax=Rhizobium sp. CFBP 8762 TaxID=2775279 RepID=UPI00177E0A91|nr:HAMP domain-containing methyl-accepting chemotaxis protein [Rhizobium sp. CFBP 8762]MBD8553380.1 HAMP domain-containing protein [Rhizobium sp. CFBP 8762]
MSFLANTQIRTKTISVILILSLISAGCMLYLGSRFKQADNEYTQFINTKSLGSVLNARTNGNLVQIGFQLSTMVISEPGSTNHKNALEYYEMSRKLVRERIAKVESLIPAYKPIIAEVQALMDKLEPRAARVISLSNQGRQGEASAAVKSVAADINAILPKLFKANDSLMAEMVDESDSLSKKTDNAIMVTAVLMLVALIASMTLSVVIVTYGITRPIANLREYMAKLADGDTALEIYGINRKDEVGQMAATASTFRANAIERERLGREAAEARAAREKDREATEQQRLREKAEIQHTVDALAGGLTQLADGNLEHRIETPFVPHLDVLRDNFNSSLSKLQTALAAVGENAAAIDAGASEIRSASDDLSKRTEQQAASVEETAAALEEITTTVKDSTRRAEEAGLLVSKTREAAEKSGAVVRNAVSAMRDIEKSSSEIGNIIGVIDDIAFQTNLLALNAGVEAARAGDAGKGFAVVAQEVRELAQRSASAAKEIKALINASSEQVRSGVTLVDETGKALTMIVDEVKEINVHVNAIVDAAREQSTGLQEINTAVNTMDQGTQQNAAMVEQTSASSHGLAQQAAELNALLSQFKLGQMRNNSMPRATSSSSRRSPSPARALGRQVATAFTGSGAAVSDGWEAF